MDTTPNRRVTMVELDAGVTRGCEAAGDRWVETVTTVGRDPGATGTGETAGDRAGTASTGCG
jgi:hypothetical protein